MFSFLLEIDYFKHVVISLRKDIAQNVLQNVQSLFY